MVWLIDFLKRKRLIASFFIMDLVESIDPNPYQQVDLIHLNPFDFPLAFIFNRVGQTCFKPITNCIRIKFRMVTLNDPCQKVFASPFI
jgi:hypothetical protein